jgi:hypothetical protein
MINEESFDLGYQKGRADERAELRELLEKDILKEKADLRQAVEFVTTGNDYNFRLGLIRKGEWLLAELGEKGERK